MRRALPDITPQSLATATHALMRRGRNRKTASVIEQWNHNWRGWDEAAAIFNFPLEGDFDYLIRCTAHGQHTLESTSANAEQAFRAPWSWCRKCGEIHRSGHHHQYAADTAQPVEEPTHLHVADLVVNGVESDGVTT